MTKDLHKQHCVPCEGGTKPMTINEEELYLNEVPDWQIDRSQVHKINREFSFKNFIAAIEFVNQVSELAESEGHHPDILIHGYKYVTITLFTHAIGGLSVNDFVLATKIDRIEK